MTTTAAPTIDVDLLALELTQVCNLTCRHCYTDSGPRAGHGQMSTGEWMSVIGQATGLGVPAIQFIGGEPTMRPAFPALCAVALDAGMQVEVFTNLTHVSGALWDLYARPGVRLAVSYYSDRAAEHDAVTQVTGSHARTRANIAKAAGLGIPVRAATIAVLPGQRAGQAQADLVGLGVPRTRIDRVRGVGRGQLHAGVPSPAELCGKCGDRHAAITSGGDVTPCVIGRWLAAGNVKDQPLAEILTSDAWRAVLAQIPPGPAGPRCGPDDGESNGCGPDWGCKPG
jgi:MoaA/NifB/PqqE/SkfB family radical SAM enzyme